MMTRTTLLALASRVEAATGADRGLDSEIHHAKCGGFGPGDGDSAIEHGAGK